MYGSLKPQNNFLLLKYHAEKQEISGCHASYLKKRGFDNPSLMTVRVTSFVENVKQSFFLSSPWV